METEAKVWYLKRNRLFAGLAESAGDPIRSHESIFTVVRRPKRTALFSQGDAAGTVYFLKEGRVRISRLTEDGKEITISMLGAGDAFGEEVIFGETVRRTIATVVEDALVCTAVAEDIFALVAANPQLSLNMARYLRDQRDEALTAVEDIAFLKVPERIVKLLERLAEQHGVPDPAGVRIDIRLTHADLASLVGSTRETVSLELSRLRDAGRILVRDRSFVLRTPALI